MLFLPGIDLDVAKQFQSILKRQGMEFKLDTKVTGAQTQADGTIKVLTTSVKDGKAAEIDTGQSLFVDDIDHSIHKA